LNVTNLTSVLLIFSDNIFIVQSTWHCPVSIMMLQHTMIYRSVNSSSTLRWICNACIPPKLVCFSNKQKCYETWTKSEGAEKKKEAFTRFISENVNLSKADESMMITGIVAPPVAMVAKRTGQTVPQLSVIKAIPDVAFVPGATILALIAIKLTKRMAFKNIPSLPQKEEDTPS